MAKPSLPPVSVLRQLIAYDPNTGAMTWRSREPEHFTASPHKSAEAKCKAFNTQFSGTPALSCDAKHGYLHGRIFDVPVYAHRAAWAIHFGEWPTEHIDHLNGNGRDNRIANLRHCPRNVNHRNRRIAINNTSGATGVFEWAPNKWSARICLRSGTIHLGTFATKEDAIAARTKKMATLGFTERHGT